MNCYIGNEKIGSGCSVFIIAEMSGNPGIILAKIDIK